MDKQLTQPLDEETLAEIIESAVSGKVDKEKYICRLSKEDKAFAKNVTRLFGLSPLENATPLQALEQVSAKVESTSCKVPLWVLADYIRAEHPEHEKAADILDKLCTALRISSKGNNGEKTVSITEIGSAILTEPEIIDVISSYTKKDVYIQAFRCYIDREDAELSQLAKVVEDQSHQYCEMVLSETAQTSGWLWNKSDISTLVEKAHQRYEIMALGREFLNLTGYTTYSGILDRLYDRIHKLGVPHSIIGEKYPMAAQFVKELRERQDVSQLLEALRASSDMLKKIYNDPQKKLAITLVREQLGDSQIDDELLFSILAEVSNQPDYSNELSVDAYIKLIRRLIEKNERNSITAKAQKEWFRITETESIERWADEVGIPAWSVFADSPDRNDLMSLLCRPDDFSTETLRQRLSILETVQKAAIDDCRKNYLKKIVPSPYRKLDISFTSLHKYLTERYGSKPNNWPVHPDVSAFVKEQYQIEIAPSIVQKLSHKNAEELKNSLLELVKNDPDIGLRLLEL